MNMGATNVELYRRLVDEVFNLGHLEVADELVAAGSVEHQASGMGDGPEGLKRIASSLRRSFPDFTLKIEAIVGHGDMVWARQRGGGKNDGSFLGQSPTGRTASIDVIDIARFEAGKMVEHWGVPDRLEMARQLGLLPAPGSQATPMP
jgi:predicted ester cyclase